MTQMFDLGDAAGAQCTDKLNKLCDQLNNAWGNGYLNENTQEKTVNSTKIWKIGLFSRYIQTKMNGKILKFNNKTKPVVRRTSPGLCMQSLDGDADFSNTSQTQPAIIEL